MEQDTIKKKWVDEMTSQLEFDKSDNSEEYKVEKICDSAIDTMELESYLPDLYYLVL